MRKICVWTVYEQVKHYDIDYWAEDFIKQAFSGMDISIKTGFKKQGEKRKLTDETVGEIVN